MGVMGLVYVDGFLWKKSSVAGKNTDLSSVFTCRVFQWDKLISVANLNIELNCLYLSGF